MEDYFYTKNLALDWDTARWAGFEVSALDLALLIFDLSSSWVRLGKLGGDVDADGANFDTK